MDLLVLADEDGVVDMTETSIAARTRIPLEKVKKFLVTLCDADERSRTPTDDGRRLRLLDDHRDWGWLIINYDKFRRIASEVQRREGTRLRTQKYRAKIRGDASVTQSDAKVTPPYASAYTFESSPKRESEGKKQLPILEIRTRVNGLFHRSQLAPWGNDEEHYLVDVAKRPDCLSELDEIERFFKLGSHRPEKVSRLLLDWTGVLDRARNFEDNKARNTPFTPPQPKTIAEKELDAMLRRDGILQ